jgi:hypothetical protein
LSSPAPGAIFVILWATEHENPQDDGRRRASLVDIRQVVPFRPSHSQHGDGRHDARRDERFQQLKYVIV